MILFDEIQKPPLPTTVILSLKFLTNIGKQFPPLLRHRNSGISRKHCSFPNS